MREALIHNKFVKDANDSKFLSRMLEESGWTNVEEKHFLGKKYRVWKKGDVSNTDRVHFTADEENFLASSLS